MKWLRGKTEISNVTLAAIVVIVSASLVQGVADGDWWGLGIGAVGGFAYATFDRRRAAS